MSSYTTLFRRARVFAVIVNYRTTGLVLDLLKSISTDILPQPDFMKLAIVDGGSGDHSFDVLNQAVTDNGWLGWCEVHKLDHNLGFAFANNYAIRLILDPGNLSEFILLLNPDTVVRSGAIASMLAFMERHSTVGICGSRLEDPDGTTQLAARRFPGVLSELEASLRLGFVTRLLNRWNVTEPESDQPHPTDWLPGASMMIRREVFEQIGLLDENYFMYFEEVDFCLRAKRAGWQVWYVPQSRVVHLVGQSSGVTSAGPQKRRPQYWFDSRKRYFEKNHGRLKRIMADLAFVVGFSLWRLRRWVQRKPDTDPPHMLGDFIRHSLTGRIRA